MKISCIALNSNLIQTNKQEKVINLIKSKMCEMGEFISLISYQDSNKSNIRRILDNQDDFTFVIGTDSTIYNHNIKENLSTLLGDKLIKVESAYLSMKKYCENHNITFSSDEELEVELPSNCIPLFDADYYNTGFMYKNNNSYIIFLPSDYNFAIKSFDKYIRLLLDQLIPDRDNIQILRCFGILEKDIKYLLKDYFEVNYLNIYISSDELDNIIYINYSKSTSSQLIRDAIASICSILSKFIYATDNSSLYKSAVDLLRIQNKKITLAETLTLGSIYKNIVSIDNQVIENMYVFNNFNNIVKMIEIDERVVEKYGKYSVNTVYELANSLLEKSSADISVCVLGDKSENMCYMAIGDIDGIHVYKNKINNSTLDNLETLSKTAIFYLIKKLKQNDLQFN